MTSTLIHQLALGQPLSRKTPWLQPWVIYGQDDRLDLYQVTNTQVLELARSTAAVVRNSDLSESTPGVTRLRTQNFGRIMGLCTEEPFRDQGTVAFCSAFLVGPDRIATAGHCIQSQTTCDTTSFVFGFGVTQAGGNPTELPSEQVYKCRRVITSRVLGLGPDYAVVELDRPVTDRAPLRVRTSGVPVPGTPLLVVGHPSGLPTKVAGGAAVRSVVGSDYLNANLDTYGGNSGSAVFNSDTGEIEGILVRGETDFVRTNRGCNVSKRCGDTDCRGEDVTLISNILPFLIR